MHFTFAHPTVKQHQWWTIGQVGMHLGPRFPRVPTTHGDFGGLVFHELMKFEEITVRGAASANTTSSVKWLLEYLFSIKCKISLPSQLGIPPPHSYPINAYSTSLLMPLAPSVWTLKGPKDDLCLRPTDWLLDIYFPKTVHIV